MSRRRKDPLRPLTGDERRELTHLSRRPAAPAARKVSASTTWQVLREAGYTFQPGRTRCPTGSAVRERKAGAATATDPDAAAEKS